MAVTLVVGALILIMLSTSYSIRLVSAPWSAVGSNASDFFKNSVSNSALSDGVPSVTLSFMRLIFPPG